MAEVAINKRQLAQVLKRLTKMGKDTAKVLKDSVDDASEEVMNHARGKHFFVGTGKGSSAKAKENEFKFTNPDGTRRFLTRTKNLLGSIQAEGAKVVRGTVTGKVTVGEEYGKRIEEGGPGMKGAKPFMKPAAEAVRPKFMKIVRNRVASYLRSQRGKG